MIGSENGIPTSTASAPLSITARTTSSHWLPSPPVTYGTSSFRPAARARPQVRFEVATGITRRSPSRSATWAASLSPRPDSVTSTVEPVGTACPPRGEPADRVRRFERGHDALGLGEELEARERLVVGRPRGTRRGPAAASIACSGPTPG